MAQRSNHRHGTAHLRRLIPYLGAYWLLPCRWNGPALHLGHRRSEDLDLFTGREFEPEAVLQKLQSISGVSLVAKDLNTVHVNIRETKVSFLGYLHPLLFACEVFLGLQVADPQDIACMKISAIAGRGTKRDFLDLYAASKRYGLDQLLQWFKEKYARTNYSMVHILKSLTYFEEAEKDPMPDVLVPLSWEETKQFFIDQAPRLL
jgi:nucleotidyltransferase AbiEii toxin of type IV toxin-antitoxin system